MDILTENVNKILLTDWYFLTIIILSLFIFIIFKLLWIPKMTFLKKWVRRT
jgi:hypothetical protein